MSSTSYILQPLFITDSSSLPQPSTPQSASSLNLPPLLILIHHLPSRSVYPSSIPAPSLFEFLKTFNFLVFHLSSTPQPKILSSHLEVSHCHHSLAKSYLRPPTPWSLNIPPRFNLVYLPHTLTLQLSLSLLFDLLIPNRDSEPHCQHQILRQVLILFYLLRS